MLMGTNVAVRSKPRIAGLEGVTFYILVLLKRQCINMVQNPKGKKKDRSEKFFIFLSPKEPTLPSKETQ